MKPKFMMVLALMCQSVFMTAQSLREDSIQEVVVTGTGTQHLLKNAPVQTEVISRRQIEQYGGGSIEDILRGLTASFDFSENDMGSHLQLNGLGNSYVLILIDGRRLHGDNGGENDLGLIDPQNIERIEIVKGASSALYGSDAIAGVINIITRRHTDSGLLIENTSRLGSYGDLRQHNAFVLSNGILTSQTNFSLQHSDGWQNTSIEAPSQTEYYITDSRNKTVNRHTNWQIAERLSWQINPQLEAYASATLYRKRIYRPSGHHPGVDIKTYDLQYNNTSATIGGKWQPDDATTITLDAEWKRHAYNYAFTDTTLTDGYVNGRLTNFFPYFPGQRELQSDQRLATVALKGVFALPYRQRFTAGLDYRYDWLRAPMRVDGGKATDNTEAVYVQDELSLLDPLFITAGLRLTRNEGFGLHLTPKLSAMLKLGDNARLRATWSQGYKSPTPKELHYQYVRNMSGVYLYLGNTDLSPQTSNYFTLSGEYTRGRLTVTLAPYYNKVDNMIALVTIPQRQAPGSLVAKYDPQRVRQYQNIEDATTLGVDLTVRYQGRHLAVGGSYSYLDTRANQYDSEDETTHRVTIDGMAHHKASWYLTWRMRNGENERIKNYAVGLYGRMSSKRYYQIDGNGKGYALWRLTGSYEWNTRKFLNFSFSHSLNFKLEAGVDNLLNYCDRTPHGLHLGTTTPGRTVFASLTLRWNKGKKLTNNTKPNLNINSDEQD
ncbi:MAG: TonB-dependent receptor [Prevotella sp.]|nr:TonB-dependent receptor [Prevotella sp.]